MRARAAAAAAVASAGILAAGWQMGTQVIEAASVTGIAKTGGTSAASASQGSAASSGLKNGTYSGAVESTRFGNVQVQLVVSGGKITDVKALQLTDAERRSQMLSATAAPILRSEVLQAQSANVDTVSGATITSDAYLSSLQGALDAAHA